MSRKSYLYVKKKENRSKNGSGTNVTANIYEVKKNKPVFVGEAKWNTAGYKGESETIYDKLKEKKLVSDKEYKSNGGYYRQSKSNIDIWSA